MAGFEELHTALQKRYGREKGQQVYQAVVPGILADFTKVMAHASGSAPAREEYFLEDGRGSIVLTARKTGGKVEIDVAFKE